MEKTILLLIGIVLLSGCTEENKDYGLYFCNGTHWIEADTQWVFNSSGCEEGLTLTSFNQVLYYEGKPRCPSDMKWSEEGCLFDETTTTTTENIIPIEPRVKISDGSYLRGWVEIKIDKRMSFNEIFDLYDVRYIGFYKDGKYCTSIRDYSITSCGVSKDYKISPLSYIWVLE